MLNIFKESHILINGNISMTYCLFHYSYSTKAGTMEIFHETDITWFKDLKD